MGDQGDTYGYRTQAEIEEWMKRCPIVRHRNYIIQNEIAPAEALDAIESEIQTQIDQAVEFAKQAPYTDPSEVFKDVYA
jgi:pyruvate dehydrogenase E1 component alpha subunit